MNLEYGPEYERFRAEVRDFLTRNGHRAPEPAQRAARPTAEAVVWF